MHPLKAILIMIAIFAVPVGIMTAATGIWRPLSPTLSIEREVKQTDYCPPRFRVATRIVYRNAIGWWLSSERSLYDYVASEKVDSTSAAQYAKAVEMMGKMECP